MKSTQPNRDQREGLPGSRQNLYPVAVLLILLSSTLLIFYNLGANSLHTLDEARHAVVAENILRDGDWLDLTYRGEPYANKPPLKFWLTALTFEAFGVSPWTVRLWSALFGLAAVAGTIALGRAVGGNATGILAGLMLATSAQFLYTHGARTGELDSALLCWFVLAMWGFVRGIDDRRAFLLGCAAAGLAGMTKHLAFTVEILGIWALGMTFARRWRAMPLTTILAGLAVTAAVALPWHLLQWARHGSEFWAGYMGREVATRAFDVGDTAGPLAYVMWIKDGLYPWAWFLPLAMWSALRVRPFRRGGAVIAAWVVVVGVLITISQVKFSWYALPLYPALGVVSARWLAGAWSGDFRRWEWAAAAAVMWLMGVSTTNAGSFNPFLLPAMSGGLEIDLGGRIAGGVRAWLPWTLVVFVVITGMAVASRRLSATSNRSVGPLFVVLLLFAALLHVGPPLGKTDTRTDLDQFIVAAARFVGDESRVAVSTADGRDISDLEVAAFRRLGIEVDQPPETPTMVIVCPPVPFLAPGRATGPQAADSMLMLGGYSLYTR